MQRPTKRNAATRDGQPRLRPTVWPGVPLEPPQVMEVHAVRSGPYLEQRATGGAEVLPDELVIRGLLDLDTFGGDQVTAFVAEHGVLTLSAQKAAGPAAYVEVAPDPTHPRPSWSTGGLWADAALWLLTAQSLARHWLLDVAGEPVVPAWTAWGRWHSELIPPEEDHAWAQWAECMNRGLGSIRARVEIQPYGEGTNVIGAPQVGLFSALCIQLFNLVVEGATPRRCENETCRQWFVRQQGRSEHGQQRRTGVIYCSRSCARAQSERERRRRARKEQQ